MNRCCWSLCCCCCVRVMLLSPWQRGDWQQHSPEERSLSQGGGCLSHNAGSTVSTSESLRVTVLRPRSGDTGGGVQGYGHQSSPPWHHLNTERVRHTHIASNSLIPRTHISSSKLQFSLFQLLINHFSSVVLTLFFPQYYIVFSGKRL